MIPPLEELIERLKALPGIGRKSAERVTFYLLNAPSEEVTRLSEAIGRIKTAVRHCSQCYNFATGELCDICASPKRDQQTICVVGQPWEILKIERTAEYHGLYHVLGGLISPMDDIGAADLRINELIERIKKRGSQRSDPRPWSRNWKARSTGMHIRLACQAS